MTKVKNYWFEYSDWKTESQWNKAGYVLIDGAAGNTAENPIKNNLIVRNEG